MLGFGVGAHGGDRQRHRERQLEKARGGGTMARKARGSHPLWVMLSPLEAGRKENRVSLVVNALSGGSDGD